MPSDPALTPLHLRAPVLPEGLKLPSIAATGDAMLDFQLHRRLAHPGQPAHALGRVELLAMQLARIQNGSPLPFDLLVFDSPQLLVFAADHGLADEGLSSWPQAMTLTEVQALLDGSAPVGLLARQHGFEVTVVDAGVATPIEPPSTTRLRARLLTRKIGFGTRNLLLGPAMSVTQAVSALHAGMDVVRHLPGNVVALGDVGVANQASAALLLSRLCGVPISDACARDDDASGDFSDSVYQVRVEKLLAAATRHRRAIQPMDVLAALGGFEIAMMVGAMLQAASERRVVLVDGLVPTAAALVARGLNPAVTDYLVFAQRHADPGHRLMLIHLQAQPLLDLGMRTHQGIGAMLAWPLLLAAQTLLER